MTQKLNSRSEAQCENLLAGSIETPTISAILKKGFVYKRGHVLGFIKTETKCVPVDKSKSDNSQFVYAVAAEDVDATNSDVAAAVYTAGKFNSSHLVFEGSNTAADHFLSARNVGILFV